MSLLMVKNMNRISSCKYFYSTFVKLNCPNFRALQYSGVNYLHASRNFSWTGFYSALSQSTPVISIQSLLVEIHQVSGLPWWVVILLTTLGIRSIIVFPLTVHQHQVISRLANINAGMKDIATELNKEVNVAKRMFNWTDEQSKKVFRIQLKKIHNDYVVRDNCHPFKAALLVLIQVPVWVCFSVSLRNITMASSAFHPGLNSVGLNLKTEGVLWFTDLTCPDPIIIPLLLLLVNLSLIEIHAWRQIGKRTLSQNILLNSSRVITVFVAAAATVNPASVTFYWLCSSTFGVGQNLFLMTPRIREIFRISTAGKESLTPFTDIKNDFKKRFKK